MKKLNITHAQKLCVASWIWEVSALNFFASPASCQLAPEPFFYQ
jgi:hypothetical protein